MVVAIRATAATTLLKAGIPDKMALQRTGYRTLQSLREYQSLDTNDTKRVSDTLSSTRADNAEVCEKQQICVANSNNIKDISSDMFDEFDVSDIELIQVLESYETSVQAEERSSSNANRDSLIFAPRAFSSRLAPFFAPFSRAFFFVPFFMLFFRAFFLPYFPRLFPRLAFFSLKVH